MLSPKARKAITISATLLAACILSTVSFTYLLFLSPSAKARVIEQKADEKFLESKAIIASLSGVAEITKRSDGLKEAVKHNKNEAIEALKDVKEAKKGYKKIIDSKGLNSEKIAVVNKKIESSNHLIESVVNFKGWIDEANKGVIVIKRLKSSFELQATALDLLNQAITLSNSGNNSDALTISNKIEEIFKKAKSDIESAQNTYRNHDLAQLKLMIDKYLECVNSLRLMTKTNKNDTAKFNILVEQLNKSTQDAAKIAKANLITKDMNSWLENNFYYEGGRLMFHYKKAIESWPQE